MGLRAEIQAAISAAFDSELNDAVKDLTYISISSTYNPVIGETSINETEYKTRGVLDKEKVQEVFGEKYKPNDVLILILAHELDTNVKIDDIIVESDHRWKVIAIRNDPADITWELLCRE